MEVKFGCHVCHHRFVGIRWPAAPDGDFSRSWVECCADCQRYNDDDAAAEALSKRLGSTVARARTLGGHFKPYLVERLERAAGSEHIDR
jgi:hypothetical protein